MSARADVETFRGIPIFSECDAVHLQLLAFSAVRKEFDAGEAIIREGESDGAAHLVLTGRVDLSTTAAGAMGQGGPGTFLGETSMIGNTAYAVTATAAEPVETARIDRELFMRVAREFPEFSRAVFNAMARKLDRSLGELERAREAFERARSFRDL